MIRKICGIPLYIFYLIIALLACADVVVSAYRHEIFSMWLWFANACIWSYFYSKERSEYQQYQNEIMHSICKDCKNLNECDLAPYNCKIECPLFEKKKEEL